MKYNPNSVYKRIDNVLYQDDVAIYKLHSTFPDWNPLTEQGAQYMERFIQMNPTWVEMIAVDCIVIDDPKIEIAVDEKDYDTFIAADLKECKTISNTKTIECNTLADKDTGRLYGKYWEDVDEIEWQNMSRLQQVQICLDKGMVYASSMTKYIHTNPSYIQRLISQIKKQS